VLSYPALEARVAAHAGGAAALVRAFTDLSRIVRAAPKSAYTCKDADDQIFIDLACEHGCLLLSKDQAVLCMAKRLAKLGVVCAAQLT
jgi:predicted nucleic acid-binding protein